MLLSLYSCLLFFTYYSYDVPYNMQLYSNSNTSYILINENDNTFDVVLGYDLYLDAIDTEYDLPSLRLEIPYSISVLEDIELSFNSIYIANNWLNFDFDVFITLSTGQTFFKPLEVNLNLFDDLTLDDRDFDFSFSTKLINNELNDYFYNLGYKNGHFEGQGVNNVITWFGSIWDGLSKILALQIAPNLTIEL